MEITLLDLSKNGVNNEMLNLIHETTRYANIRIKTPAGNSEAKDVENIIMQGETVSSILCTSSLDTISKESPVETLKYRDKVEIPKLGYVVT